MLVPYTRDGRVANDPGVEYVLTNSPGVNPAGELVYAPGGWRVYRIEGPIRLRSSITGVHTDGWMGGFAAYNEFGSGRRGIAEVHVTRAFAPGDATVTVRAGALRPEPLEVIANPCSAGVCRDYNPKISGRATAHTRKLAAGDQYLFRIPVTSPFRVEVRVDPTFRPFDFGGTDLRQLGAQIAFTFKPGA